ncbi:MAG: hypothetical protein EAY65_00190 [Alphaproteobacteria bacterium]|nr:MAG: hypothetical protein EAY65_00190 [Alphaproteobacteria bacterium]
MSYEQRLTVRLVDIWEQLRHERPPPPYEQWNSAKISDLWQKCIAMRVEPHQRTASELVVRTLFVGQQLNVIMPTLRAEECYQMHILDHDMKKLFSPITSVVQSQKSIAHDGTFVSKNNTLVKYRCCFLPFSDSKKYTEGGANVHYIVAGFSWIHM